MSPTNTSLNDSPMHRSHGLGGDKEALRELYRSWAHSYDRDVLSDGYVAPFVISALMLQHMDAVPSPRILDAGCGTGLVGAEVRLRLQGAELVGADLSHDMCTLAGKRGVYDHVVGGCDLNQDVTPEWRGAFDAVVCCGTFTNGHVGPSRIGALFQACRQSGTVTLSVRRSFSDEKLFPEAVQRLVDGGSATVIAHMFNGPYIDEEGADYWCLLKS